MIIPIWMIFLLHAVREMNPELELSTQALQYNQTTVFCSDKIHACTDVRCPEEWTMRNVSMKFKSVVKGQKQTDTLTMDCYQLVSGDKKVIILTSQQKKEIDHRYHHIVKAM